MNRRSPLVARHAPHRTRVPLTLGLADEEGIAKFDSAALRRGRLANLQSALQACDCAAGVFFDPISIRYATGTRNMSVWLLRNPARYCFVPAHGKPTLFEFPNPNCQRNAAGNDTLAEVRQSCAHFYTMSWEHRDALAGRWAAEIADLLAQYGGHGQRLAVDRLDAAGFIALERLGVTLGDGIEVSERARLIKTPDEAALLHQAVEAAELGIRRMRQMLRPGISENRLWAEISAANAAEGGEWMESRLLTSGPRTNPWFQEASERRVEAGDLISLDTDLIGPGGYCADISRCYVCGPSTARQRTLYALAHEQINHNAGNLGPGVTFEELARNAWKIPEIYRAQYYGMLAHGVGMADEGPVIAYEPDAAFAPAGALLPGMCVSVESYLGEEAGPDGVKLEQQYLITAAGAELLGSEPLPERLESHL